MIDFEKKNKKKQVVANRHLSALGNSILILSYFQGKKDVDII